ncbi:MAG: acetoacetate--CoA ligase [Candidatus Marinimicrobia bacterium]|nr:acetoacetate--CoA ligase [Candidatus Neomarinimicrobiota bacterium]MBT3682684.1 acetoacetate--CoA ligase [Candidatus Neomarinimicrobiota bacterium]MBT3759661.1 acetoacetate--CoA ligase [Candidatus Neomarinimicrobiota bacterium]MBT3894467.1 acetoacetate--CoA ligase [Candidatus Neomarinimicrobiota bacterium]MBT4172510.1 acetoacetate--CoA ligase [Candidatus Neomarinimicrobiota bacterium]
MAKILWSPSDEQIANSQMDQFRLNVCKHFNVKLANYSDLHTWSVNHIEDFWGFAWKYFDIIHSGSFSKIVDDANKMPGAKWFEGANLNYAENLLRYRDDRIAIRFKGEEEIEATYTYNQLYDKVTRTAKAFKDSGVKKGDRVAGFMPNIPETIIAMLATASLGAIWSSCSPDFGINGVLDRFSQIEPTILIAADGYYYKGKAFDSLKKLAGILHKLPSIQKTIIVNYINQGDISVISNAVRWTEFTDTDAKELEFVQVPFDHPLYIMYSSGTTGKPKSIVHSVGGTLIQHLKELVLHTNITKDDNVFYFTTCGWMMWNWLVSTLATGATVVLFDGNPFYPKPESLVEMADKYEISVFGTSAKYISSLEAENVNPSTISNFPRLKSILSTGSPLAEESFDYVYNKWKKNVTLSSISGGTDIISCFALGNPVLPVYRGELQCVGLAMDVVSFDGMASEIVGEKGELVCRHAFPSMPVYFWNDPDGLKYLEAYFTEYDNMWRHGDYIEINDHGGVKIYGRSDATLNPGGVRIGTAEIYRVAESIPQVEDSVAVGQKFEEDERIILFVKLKEGEVLDDNLIREIKSTIFAGCSPRHVPAIIIQVDGIPYTINGKKVEIAISKIIHGQEVTNKDALSNPEVLDEYRNHPQLV